MANIINVRIDDRLIHGQVASWWSTKLNIQRIIVANNKVATNETQKMALKMSVPSNCFSSMISIETASSNLKENKYGDQRIMLIANCPQDLQKIINLGVTLNEINVGNLSNRNNTTKVTNSIYISKEEYLAFKEISKLGVVIVNQMTPDDKKNDFMKIINELSF